MNNREQRTKTPFFDHIPTRKIIYIAGVICCLTPFISPPIALFLGLVFALTLGTPFPTFNKKMSKYLLQVSVVGLGFGMNLLDSVKAGSDGMLFTLFSVVSVMFMGIMIGKWLPIQLFIRTLPS